MFQKWIKNKLIYHKFVKLIFFTIVTVLIILITHQHTSPSINPTKTKVKSVTHIREPTDNMELIIATKQHYVVDVPKPKQIKYHIKILATITSYTSGYESTGKTPSNPAYKITASGKKVEEGVTLACPKQYPFGTVVMIQGIGKRVCQDFGGSIKGNHFDLYVESYDTAIKFGVQHREILILGG